MLKAMTKASASTKSTKVNISPEETNHIAQIEGAYTVDPVNGITGWIWDSTNPNDALDLELVVAGVTIAESKADKFDMELVELHKGNGRHAFSMKARIWPDVQLPTVAIVKIRGANVPFAEIVVESLDDIAGIAAQAPVGHVDGIFGGEIRGWAWDRANPSVPTSVDLYRDGTLLTTLPCSQFREDLLRARYGDGRGGFSFALPVSLLDSKPSTITVCFAGTTIPLANGVCIFGYPHESSLRNYLASLNNEIANLKLEVATVEERLMERHEALLTIQRDNIERELQVLRKLLINPSTPAVPANIGAPALNSSLKHEVVPKTKRTVARTLKKVADTQENI